MTGVEVITLIALLMPAIDNSRGKQKQLRGLTIEQGSKYCMPQTVWTFNLKPKRLKRIG